MDIKQANQGRLEAFQHLVECGDVEALADLLSAAAQAERWAVFEQLKGLGRHKAVPFLLKLLRSRDAALRRDLISFLGYMQGKRVFKALVQVIQEDPDAGV